MPLFICPTPIGNLEDVTLRVLRILKECDVIFAEDTRRTRILLNKYGIERKKLYSYNKNNWKKRIPLLKELLSEGKSISLVSDAGTPGISDVGAEAIKFCIEEGFKIEVLPGPTAFVPALLLSGITPHPFIFYGFLPSQKGKRLKTLKGLRDLPFTLVFYESPHRIYESLCDILEMLGDRKACLVREITKLHEEALRGYLSELLAKAKDLKGEIVLVVEGNENLSKGDVKENIEERITSLLKKGLTSKEVVKKLSEEIKLPKREIYKMVLKLKRGDKN
ncbi:MAG: 16S rRNA (cytidine(1402)-2'-O)-methyltransferase [Synergistetes bacterium]|nr:16S rRNA (cytidine(1402)-2'-O)-methyltransferase [Synergistota bacterium]